MATTEKTEQERDNLVLRVDDDGGLLIPSEIVTTVGLEPGESVEIGRTLFGLHLVPIRTDEEMEAFWGPNWLADMEQSNADVAAGRTTFYESGEAFLADLEARHRANL